jgi:hypothetical protein
MAKRILTTFGSNWSRKTREAPGMRLRPDQADDRAVSPPLPIPHFLTPRP